MSRILLVHGSWHGPWCWNDFAHRLSAGGHEVHTVRLRGHDGRTGRLWYRLLDYLEDVELAAAQFDSPPIIVGHSLGGLLVQKYLERHAAAGAVLMASIPPAGGLPAVLRFALRHPLVLLKANLLLSLGSFTSPASLVREMFFSPGTPQQIVDDCMGQLQNDSYRMFLRVLWQRFRPPRVPLPVLVLGAEKDGFFTPGEVEKTARAYGTEAQIFPGMGHNLMLDSGWQAVADRVDGWAREVEAGRGALRASG
jgi:pimeloyl-ACP methyl ester carboxylesterase